MNWLKTHFSFEIDFLTIILLAVACGMFDLAIFEYIKEKWLQPLGLLNLANGFILIVGAITSWQLSRDSEFTPEWRSFWRWTIFCWLLVLGRAFMWGRLILGPEMPRSYSMIVAIVLVLLVVIFLLADKVYLRAWQMLIQMRLPAWIIFIGISMFFLVKSAGREGMSFQGQMAVDVAAALKTPVFLALVFMTIRLAWEAKRYLGVAGYQNEAVEGNKAK
jgi:hypothetical protein